MATWYALPRMVRSSSLFPGWLSAGRVGLIAIAISTASVGCRSKALEIGARGDAGDAPGGLTAQQAAMVIARVGDRDITLGEYAATIDRMDQFDRLRYQTPERRRELLDQIITVELLAAEAKRRGLDKDPETAEALRQILRDAMMVQLRKKMRAPADIPDAEVRAYYESHQSEFREPERRRVAHIVVKDKAKAEKLLADAKKANPHRWGELAMENSLDAPGKDYKGPIEQVGDLGLVGPAGDSRGDNPRVPDELRKAVFDIQRPGEVLDRIVQTSDGSWHVLKLVSKTDAHARSFAEADRTIRILISQNHQRELVKELENELRKQFAVQIDDAALAKVRTPTIVDPVKGSTHGDPAPMDHHHDHDHND